MYDVTVSPHCVANPWACCKHTCLKGCLDMKVWMCSTTLWKLRNACVDMLLLRLSRMSGRAFLVCRLSDYACILAWQAKASTRFACSRLWCKRHSIYKQLTVIAVSCKVAGIPTKPVWQSCVSTECQGWGMTTKSPPEQGVD